VSSYDSRQIERLVYADWEDPYAAIHVRDDLSLADAEKSILFRNARTLLNALWLAALAAVEQVLFCSYGPSHVGL
jgi:hypothetical protein